MTFVSNASSIISSESINNNARSVNDDSRSKFDDKRDAPNCGIVIVTYDLNVFIVLAKGA
jgi:hypothetical protein